MNKKILFAAVGAALAVAPMISAQADVKVGGSAHVSLDSLDQGIATDTGSLFVASNSSNFNMSASEDLGGGMKALFFFETLLIQDAGGVGGGRNTYVGLNGGFGTVKLGYFDDAMKKVGRSVDLFYNEQLGESRAITRQTNWDERMANTIGYESNPTGGLSFEVQYGVEDAYTNDNKTLALGVSYKAGPLYLAAAHKSIGYTAPLVDGSAIRVVGSYDMGAIKFTGFYQQVSDNSGTTGADRTTMGLGVALKSGNNTFKAQWYQADAADNAATANGGDQLSFGIDHNLSKTTIVYATYAKSSNDAAGTFGIGGNGHGATATPAAGQDASGISLGMRMKF